ncbi:translation initiation factor IF-1 [bacterium]|nr:translation initiation factor IF-1 [bacterium]
MSQKDKNVIVVEGVIKECLPDTRFLVEIDINGQKHEILGYLSGKMRMNYIWLLVGDKVKLEISPYDTKIGRITYRNK